MSFNPSPKFLQYGVGTRTHTHLDRNEVCLALCSWQDGLVLGTLLITWYFEQIGQRHSSELNVPFIYSLTCLFGGAGKKKKGAV